MVFCCYADGAYEEESELAFVENDAKKTTTSNSAPVKLNFDSKSFAGRLFRLIPVPAPRSFARNDICDVDARVTRSLIPC